MKQIIRHFILREPRQIDFNKISSKYKTITFFPETVGQTFFEDILPEPINDINKSECYINGMRYNPDLDYKINDGLSFLWIHEDFILDTECRIVLVWR